MHCHNDFQLVKKTWGRNNAIKCFTPPCPCINQGKIYMFLEKYDILYKLPLCVFYPFKPNLIFCSLYTLTKVDKLNHFANVSFQYSATICLTPALQDKVGNGYISRSCIRFLEIPRFHPSIPLSRSSFLVKTARRAVQYIWDS